MGFPDRIERTVELAARPERVWAALTTAEGLGAWFGDEAAIELLPGGAAWMKWAGRYTVDMRVERVEEPTVFGFTWQISGLPEDDPRRTYVEFTLEPPTRAGAPSWPRWPQRDRPRPRTWPAACRSRGRRSPNTSSCWPRPAW